MACQCLAEVYGHNSRRWRYAESAVTCLLNQVANQRKKLLPRVFACMIFVLTLPVSVHEGYPLLVGVLFSSCQYILPQGQQA